MEQKRYFPEVTLARGLIALLVIAGHAFPDGHVELTSPAARLIHDFIYGFHMGAFIFLAGFVAAPKLLTGCDGRKELGKRFQRLMVPYLCWTALLLVLKQPFSALARQAFAPGGALKLIIGARYLGWLWYLWTLFVISAVFLAVFRCRRDARLGLAVGLMLYLAHPLIPDSPLARVGQYAIFYALGIWARAHWQTCEKWIDHPLVPVVGALLPLAGVYAPIPYLLTGCAGTALVLHIARRMERRPGRARDFWMEFGNRSYDIYLLGYYVQTPVRVVLDSLLHAPYWPQVLLCAALGLLVPLWLSRAIGTRFPRFRRLFLGHAQ